MSGLAWRFKLPTDLIGYFTINLLEFIASAITIDMILRYDTKKNEDIHILAITDSSSAMGWLHHSTFDPVNNKNHDKVARWMATKLLQREGSLFSTHIPGNEK